ncbi:MAG: NAD(+)/NADH kinase, partial [Bacteroidota bacterium]
MHIALHSKSLAQDTFPFVTQLLQYLHQQQTQLFVSPPLQTLLSTAASELPPMQPLEQDLTHLDLMVSLGGDGTLLEAVNYVGTTATPVLGINTGRMGFLATVAPEEGLAALASFFQGQYSLDQRTLLQAETDGVTSLVPNFALNEIAVLKQDSSSMIAIQVC